jgi:hypothetical protein
VTFADVGHIPGGYSSLSIPKLLETGWILSGNNETGLTLTKGTTKLKFDNRIETPTGYMWAMYAPSRHEDEVIMTSTGHAQSYNNEQ